MEARSEKKVEQIRNVDRKRNDAIVRVKHGNVIARESTRVGEVKR